MTMRAELQGGQPAEEKERRAGKEKERKGEQCIWGEFKEGQILTRGLYRECESLRRRRRHEAPSVQTSEKYHGIHGKERPEVTGKGKKKATVCDRIQACFSGNGNPLMHVQAEARHIHICILDEIFHGIMEDEFEGSLKYVPSHFSHAWLFVTLWTVACQAPLSMGLSRQEYWSRLPCTSQGDLPYPGIEPLSLMSPALAGRFFATSTTWEVPQTKKEDEYPQKISGLVLM